MEPLLSLVAIVGIMVTIVWLTIRSAERAGAELGRCEPCRIDEGVARQMPDTKGGGPWSWVSPMCCERDGKRRRRRRRKGQ